MEKYDDHGGYKWSNTIDLTVDTDDVDDGRYKGSNTIDLTADTDDVETNKRDFSFVGATTFDASTSEPMLKQVKIEKDWCHVVFLFYDKIYFMSWIICTVWFLWIILVNELMLGFILTIFV
jgi:hypothetical protein